MSETEQVPAPALPRATIDAETLAAVRALVTLRARAYTRTAQQASAAAIASVLLGAAGIVAAPSLDDEINDRTHRPLPPSGSPIDATERPPAAVVTIVDRGDSSRGLDGRDGRDGPPGRDGRDGQDGRDVSGRDGRDGRDGRESQTFLDAGVGQDASFPPPDASYPPRSAQREESAILDAILADKQVRDAVGKQERRDAPGADAPDAPDDAQAEAVENGASAPPAEAPDARDAPAEVTPRGRQPGNVPNELSLRVLFLILTLTAAGFFVRGSRRMSALAEHYENRAFLLQMGGAVLTGAGASLVEIDVLLRSPADGAESVRELVGAAVTAVGASRLSGSR